MSGDSSPRSSPGSLPVSPLRRTKIICTIGPSSNSEPALRSLFEVGMDIARLNFSHGSHQEHATAIRNLRRVAEAEGRTVCILEDLQGPKIRTGPLAGHQPVTLEAGGTITITTRDREGTSDLVATTFKGLPQEVRPGSPILLSDGRIELEVEQVRGDEVVCRVINGGTLREHQGINLPGAALAIPALTEKDRTDLEFGLEHGVDAIALSFVRSPRDVAEAKAIIAGHRQDIPVIAKLEKPQALDRLEAILEVADGVMVARGDLGVEMPLEKVPVIQKYVIRRAAEWRKPVIIATQMLESMIENPRPTRAEASDVANAIFDGTDAVMLSAETASGRYPREAVCVMARIIVEAESSPVDRVPRRRHPESRQLSISETICESIAHAAEDHNMAAIAVFTETGNTARMLSKYRPKCRIYAFSHVPAVCNRMNLFWGVQPVRREHALSADEMVATAEQELVRTGRLHSGEVLGVAAGTQMASGSTNFMRLHVVGRRD